MSLLVDVTTLGGVSVEPELVGVDIRTWIVNEVLSTVQVYMQSMTIITASIQHSEVLPQALDWNQLTFSFFMIRSWTITWCTTCCRNCSPTSC